ncbi:right-handed parallel beta-helix repeat-containing protein [Sunxiuqinia sp. A32]|uniref:right-handed parallel beta-helix repeat-containing protein n=1 Tax=Sunxiuqinia sp. A32 TaxID=3461496 RepID=UPI0040458A80
MRLDLKYLVKSFIHIALVILAFACLISCEDEKYASSADIKLGFSVDTVMFDTIFTTIGSTTQHLKVYNPYDQKLLISNVRLAGGEDSNFRLNINGTAANELYDIEILPKDSIYIFVEVTVDPTGGDFPMVVQDSIEFLTNANLQDIDLVAWGQDFKLIKDVEIQTSTWTSEKPYLVYNYAYVDSGAVLTIEPGTKIYFHNRAGLYVKGTVNAKGTVDEPVVFQGDRLEDAYEDVPDQWNGILLFSGSEDNVFEQVEIKNANIGLQVGTIENEGSASVKLSGVKIQNMAYAGIFAMKSKIEATNCLISNCGFYCAALLVGGDYTFNHTTIGNYWGGYSNRARSTASLMISDHVIIDRTNGSSATYVGELNKATFSNSIIAGNISSRNELELAKTDEVTFNYKFDHCLIQLADTFNTSNKDNYISLIKGEDPRFIDPYDKMNFELDTLSPAKDVGSKLIGNKYPFDIKNDSRTDDDGPDLGAFERIEKSDD